MAPHNQQPRTAQYYIHQEITPKKPPGWDPGYNRAYSFDKWVKDMAHWSNSTDVPDDKQGSLVILQLGGLAREYVQDLDGRLCSQGGQIDVNGHPQDVIGLQYILLQLKEKFANLWQEEQEKA